MRSGPGAGEAGFQSILFEQSARGAGVGVDGWRQEPDFFTEGEGSEIARQVVRALLDKQIKVFFVTHMYDLAHGFYAQGLDTALFLRAERQPDGRRTFKLVEREPLPTSYGEDAYRRIFGTGEATSTALADTRR